MENNEKDYQRLLSDPFEEDEVEWRVQASGHQISGKAWVRLVPYIDSRAVQQRLDNVMGVAGWENAFTPTPDGRGMLCGITIHYPDRSVTKWDGAEIPRALTEEEIKNGKRENIDPIKTALSNAEKRSSVQHGLGRYLYKFEVQYGLLKEVQNRWNLSNGATFIEIKKGQQLVKYEWFPLKMPEWAMPSVQSKLLIKNISTAEDVLLLRSAFKHATNYANSFNRPELIEYIIKAKDERKFELNKISQAENESTRQEIFDWLERAVEDDIVSTLNASALNLAQHNVATDLNALMIKHDIGKEHSVDMLNFLKTNYQSQLVKLNKGVK